MINYAQTKTNVTANSTKKDSDLDLGKRVDHTLGGVDVPKLALKGLVADATAPLTKHNVKSEEQKADESKGNTLPLTHYQDVADFANGAKAKETKKDVTAWELPAYLATRVSHKPPAPIKLVQKSDSDGLFKLMDANVTRGNLKNLVTDKPSPITVGLAQKSDADGLFKLMDANVTRGNLKNLVTDKPSPITVGLAQKSDADGLFKLMDANVTRGNLKNLVTDKPSPITVGLVQLDSDMEINQEKKSENWHVSMLMTDSASPGLKRASDEFAEPSISTLLQQSEQPVKERRLTDIGDFIQLDGVPVLVNPESTLYQNTQAATNFGFVDVPVGLDEVNFLQ